MDWASHLTLNPFGVMEQRMQGITRDTKGQFIPYTVIYWMHVEIWLGR